MFVFGLIQLTPSSLAYHRVLPSLTGVESPHPHSQSANKAHGGRSHLTNAVAQQSITLTQLQCSRTARQTSHAQLCHIAFTLASPSKGISMRDATQSAIEYVFNLV